MSKKKIIALLMCLAVACTMLAGCGSTKKASGSGAAKKTEAKKTIRLGVRSDGVDMANLMVKPLKKMGYKLEIVSFEDSIQPNVALGEGKIDANLFQHIPYLKAYNEENKKDFVMVKPYLYYPLFGMYSSKYKKVSQIPDGATIGLCNDASNQARGLNMLVSQKLITLKKGVETPTIHDIKDNPHKFKFVEAEMTTMANAIDDYDAICLAAAHMATAGKDGNSYICQSDDAKEYALGVVVNPKDKDAKWVQDLIKSVQTKEMANYFAKDKQGTLVPFWTNK
ncbi:D-methionine transport system substrate-binding protein [Eubacterium pyruvativorans]|uniref:D-methionine transport system substrate-binding protein n=1 Tax=Eubacterium pyruvativorans TaxID=155865 RepID=A0A1I7IBK3_9FIRM|nr:MetQ/NlpA family ABC transporter substrate-binding protein [Eubacterium pyruvativorans]SFO40058.1 D-methionine transport system substrate-binding protein [Eubacterium pyruvativorans]SFU70311.1 D-methionine transport system substrate-binding protein [Eubacterium pyruvativorans]